MKRSFLALATATRDRNLRMLTCAADMELILIDHVLIDHALIDHVLMEPLEAYDSRKPNLH